MALCVVQPRIIWIFLTVLLFSSIGEYLFWDEFSTRYNFIAVDYLVYTQEVLANIFQSYPVKIVIAAIAAFAAAIVFCLRRWIRAVETSQIHVEDACRDARASDSRSRPLTSRQR